MKSKVDRYNSQRRKDFSEWQRHSLVLICEEEGSLLLEGFANEQDARISLASGMHGTGFSIICQLRIDYPSEIGSFKLWCLVEVPQRVYCNAKCSGDRSQASQNSSLEFYSNLKEQQNGNVSPKGSRTRTPALSGPLIALLWFLLCKHGIDRTSPQRCVFYETLTPSPEQEPSALHCASCFSHIIWFILHNRRVRQKPLLNLKVRVDE